jgi:hypothetical protein
MIIGETCNKFNSFDKDRGDNNSVKRNFYIIFIDETKDSIFRTLAIFCFKNN